MNKFFTGQVLKSESNEFVSGNGETVSTWRIGVQLTDERGITFNISKNHPLYEQVRLLEQNDVVRVEAEPEIRMDGFIRYKMVKFDLLEDANPQE